MPATTKAEKVIGIWLDQTSDPDEPAWIVSRDRMNEKGEAETTDTVEWRNVNEHDDACEQAKEVAIELARKEGLCVVQTEGDQSQSVVYAPKRITVTDGIGHMRETLRLYGDTLEGSEWVTDILRRNGCEVDDEMLDEEIADRVRDAWTGEGYDGDPAENGLTVRVETEKAVIERGHE